MSESLSGTSEKDDTVALSYLREKLSAALSRATLLQERADEAWADYTRRSDSVREAWREHGQLLAAVRELEDWQWRLRNDA